MSQHLCHSLRASARPASPVARVFTEPLQAWIQLLWLGCSWVDGAHAVLVSEWYDFATSKVCLDLGKLQCSAGC